MNISTQSKEYLRVSFSSNVDVGSFSGVELAVLPRAEVPEEADWHDATIDGDEAVILVGPGSTIGQLATGVWHVWARISDLPEIPVEDVGAFSVTR